MDSNTLHLRLRIGNKSTLTQQRAARHLAGPGDPAHHRGGHAHVQAAAGEVVEEEERLGTLRQHVVHTHGHQVLAEAAVLAARLGNLQANQSSFFKQRLLSTLSSFQVKQCDLIRFQSF